MLGQNEFDVGQSNDLNHPPTFDLVIHINPVNNRPPTAMVGSAVFSCNEAGSKVLSTRDLMAYDLDTPKNKLSKFKIKNIPKFVLNNKDK